MVELLNSHLGLLTRLINFGVVLESKRAKLCHRFNIISLSNFLCQVRGGEEALGLPEEGESPGPREQAVLHPGQAHGACLRQGEDQGLWHGQVPQGAP